MITLNLPYPPSVNSIWRHGRGKSGKTVVYLDQKYVAWKREADMAFLQQKRDCGEKIIGQFDAAIWFDETRRRKNTDIDNRIKVVLDALQRFGVIQNDSLLNRICSAWMPVDGVYVKLFPAEAA